MHTNKSITVSIVSHGQLELIYPLIEQLSLYCSKIIEKVVLTLNISEPDHLLKNKAWGFPVQVIKNSKPRGFGSNHNQAFRQCKTPWYLVLNPDIRLDNDVLTPLTTMAAVNSGILTPRILEPGKTKPEPHRSIITPLEIVMRKRSGYKQPTTPNWIPGLFMQFRSEAYAKINGFDEKRFFMYGEDFDICARTRLAGWHLQVGEDLAVIHDAQRASHINCKHLYWHTTSLLKIWTTSVFWKYKYLSNH